MKLPKLIKRIDNNLAVIFTIEDIKMLKIKEGNTVEVIAKDLKPSDLNLNSCPKCGELLDLSKGEIDGRWQCKCNAILTLNKKLNQLEEVKFER